MRVTGQSFRDSFAQGTVPALEPELSLLRGMPATGGAPLPRSAGGLHPFPFRGLWGRDCRVSPQVQPPHGRQAGALSHPRYLGHAEQPLARSYIRCRLERTPLCKTERRALGAPGGPA